MVIFVHQEMKGVLWLRFFGQIRILIFEEGLEFSRSFWTMAPQTNCQELAESAFLRELTDRKLKEKKEGR